MLAEVAFKPEFLTTRIEKERRAVLAEAQMMNTIEYRVDCCLLKYLHAENALGYRFPIGKTEQVSQTPHAGIIYLSHLSWYDICHAISTGSVACELLCVACELLWYAKRDCAGGQVEQWDRAALVDFWQKWYFPGNATLYVVGELDRSVQQTEALIQQTFGNIPAGREGVPSLLGGSSTNGQAPGPLKQRHPVRSTPDSV